MWREETLIAALLSVSSLGTVKLLWCGRGRGRRWRSRRPWRRGRIPRRYIWITSVAIGINTVTVGIAAVSIRITAVSIGIGPIDDRRLIDGLHSGDIGTLLLLFGLRLGERLLRCIQLLLGRGQLLLTRSQLLLS